MDETNERKRTRSLWKSAEGKAGKLAVSLWKWAAEDLQGVHSAKRKAIRFATEAAEKATRCRSVGECCWDAIWGLVNPGWVV
ncbi:unnamed protein product [Merluccius merluccius]